MKNKLQQAAIIVLVILTNALNIRAQELEIFSVVTGTDENAITKLGFKNSSGTIVVAAKYDEIMNFNGYFVSGLQSARIGQKWTFIDRTGKEVIPFKYNLTHDFSEGLAAVNLGACCHDVAYTAPMGGKWGYINKSGVVIIPIVYDYAGDFKEGLSYVMKYNIKDDKYSESKYALINKAGKLLTTFKYDSDLKINGGVICASANHKFGFLDKTGKEVIALIYDYAHGFSEGLAAVKKGDKWGFIDNTGKVIIPIEYENKNSVYGFTYGFVEGCSPAKKNGKIGFINKTGKEITPFEFDELEEFNQERAAVKRGVKWGFVGRKGNIIVEIKYDKVKNIGNNGLKITTGFRDGNEYSLDSTGKETFVKEAVKPKTKQPETTKTNSPKTEPEIKTMTVSPETYYNAVVAGDIVKITTLMQSGLNINAPYTFGNNYGLLDAITKKHFDLATLLIEKGASVNAKNQYGETALHLAVSARNIYLVELLLKKGADRKIRNKNDGLTAEERARANASGEIAEKIKNFK